jgi:hypothetical protein
VPLTAHLIHFFSDRPHRRSTTAHSLDTVRRIRESHGRKSSPIYTGDGVLLPDVFATDTEAVATRSLRVANPNKDS